MDIPVSAPPVVAARESNLSLQKSVLTKISSKLMLVLVLVSIVPLIITGLITVEKSKRAIHTEIENTVNTIADYKVLQIQKYFDNQESFANVLAKSPVIRSALSRLPNAFQQGIESTEYRALDAEIRDFLEYYKTTRHFEDIYLISDDADIVFSLQHKSDFGTNLYDGPYESATIAYAYDLSLTMRGSNFSGFDVYEPSGNEYSAFIAIPLYAQGRPLGVVAIQMKTNILYDFTSDYTGLKRTGEVMLGKQEFDKVLLVSPLRHDENAAYKRYLEPRKGKYLPIQQAIKGESSSGRYVDYRGQSVIAAWRYLPRLHWGMVVKIDEAEAFQAALRLQRQILRLGLVFLILVVAVAILFARGLSRPISSLAAASRRIEGGELDYQVDVEGRDEIAELGHSFNKMTKKLKQSLDQAQAATVAKTQFLTTMSHEIRTPMNGVMGMAQLLEDTSLDDEQKEFVNVINRSGKELLNIINDILDYSNLDAGRLNLVMMAFDLEATGRECLGFLRNKAIEKKLDLVFEYQVDSPRFFSGDQKRIRQVILKLLDNAIKFSDSGTVRLAISVAMSESRSASIQIEVEDSGIGLDAEAREKLFLAFSQVDQSISRRYGGTGLGLAITRKIADLMQGEVSVESTPGEGSCFKVRLNLALVDMNEGDGSTLDSEYLEDAGLDEVIG